jgi:hypothetical protein
VNRQTRQIICTSFANGKKHDFRLFKESKTHIHPKILAQTDTGYVGIKKIHANSILPIKRRRKQELTKEEKRFNRHVSSGRALNENSIGYTKRFHVVSDKCRNRRKRFRLRFNLISGICNFETHT